MKLQRMYMTSNRSNKGLSLALTSALSVVVVIVGVFAIFLMREFGGSRELQNSTDAGGLSVAKQAIKSPSISLSGDLETTNFSGLTDNNGTVDLVGFNRLFGQALIVAINAQVEGTPQAQQNANKVISAIHSPSGGIAQRLCDRLSLWDNASANFDKLASSNSMRMLPNGSENGVASKYQAAFVDRGESTNIYLDQKILPKGYQLPNGVFAAVNSPTSGLPYIKGYTDISLGDGKLGQLAALAGATVNPLRQPHLISQSTFQTNRKNPVQAGAVPPNSFQSAAQTRAGIGNGLQNTTCSEVGVLSTDYPACIPHGYIVITNGPGLNVSGTSLASNESIYNNQLFTGIFVANNGVFSTDESQIVAWATYNNNNQAGQAPSTDDLFNVSGLPVSGEQNQIISLGGNGYPTMVDYTNVQGPNANPAAVAMLPAFNRAYPAPTSAGTTDGTLTAVEDLKAQVIAAYVADSDQQITSFTPTPISTSGMRIFSHNQAYPVGAGQSPQITTPGNIAQLCAQADSNGDPTVVCNKLKQRMKEINPAVTDGEMNTLLGLDSTGAHAVANSGQTIDLGQTYYIYQQNGTFVMVQTPPVWIANGTTPDGSNESDTVSFQTVGLSVDPVGEEGFNQTLFASQPDPSTNDLGTDQAIWQPSCGLNNLLGQLTFQEMVSPSAIVVVTPPIPAPSPTPSPPPVSPPVSPPVTAPVTTPAVTPGPCNSSSINAVATALQNYVESQMYANGYTGLGSTPPQSLLNTVAAQVAMHFQGQPAPGASGVTITSVSASITPYAGDAANGTTWVNCSFTFTLSGNCTGNGFWSGLN
jgi:hypothetical protein